MECCLDSAYIFGKHEAAAHNTANNGAKEGKPMGIEPRSIPPEVRNLVAASLRRHFGVLRHVMRRAARGVVGEISVACRFRDGDLWRGR